MARPLLLLGEIPEPASRPRLAIAAKGFRPFFLLAAVFAVAFIPLWLMVIAGVAHPAAYLDPPSWHAHEMIFGFLVAVIAGFLLTAVGNWTQRETLVGPPLLALSAVWLVGRIAMALGERLPRVIPAIADLAFLPLLIVALARPLIAAKNRRNFVMLAVLAALFAANVVVHLGAQGLLPPGSARRGCAIAIDLVALIVLIIAGRVFPMFTRNATGVTSIRSIASLEVLTIGGMALVVALDVFAPSTLLGASLAGIVGALAAARAVHWGARHSLRHPLLWILHAGYAWLVLGLLLRLVAALDVRVPESLATHALTVGAFGSLTLGMMARVALGHTGRPLAASTPMAWAFVAISASAIARVFVPLLAPRWSFTAVLAAGALWTIAFFVFVVVYAPILAGPRRDGKPG